MVQLGSVADNRSVVVGTKDSGTDRTGALVDPVHSWARQNPYAERWSSHRAPRSSRPLGNIPIGLRDSPGHRQRRRAGILHSDPDCLGPPSAICPAGRPPSPTVTDPATGQFGLTVPIDSVESVNVNQTPFLAEFGRFTAGLVWVETRRGGGATRNPVGGRSEGNQPVRLLGRSGRRIVRPTTALEGREPEKHPAPQPQTTALSQT